MTDPKPATSKTSKITTIDATTTVMIPNSIKDDTAVIASDEAATVTISSTSTTAAATPTEEEETPEKRNQRILTHQLLAGQLEYYFSVTNLSRDTYLSTLRELNDGYVPLSIIANFGKVQAFAPYEIAWDAVCAAATDYSDLLEMVELDEQGKKVSVITSESRSNNNNNNRNMENTTFLAVGTISGKAIPMSQIQSQQTQRRRSSNDDTTPSIPSKPPATTIATATATTTNSHPSSSPTTLVRTPSSDSAATATAISINNNNVQNTIILREVSDDVEEQVVRNLFDSDKCPSIQSIHLDLHNCWFVTFDTKSRDEMVNVMMNLRTKKFPSGESVIARLKSSVSAATHSPLSANAVIYTHPKASTMYAPQFYNNNSGATDDNRRKKRSSNYKARNSNRDSNNGGSSSNSSNYDNKTNIQQGVGNEGHPMKRNNSKDKSSSLSQCPSSSSSNNNTNINNKAVATVGKVSQSPPSLGEVHFPSLPPSTDDNSLPFQVEKVPTEDEMMRGGEKGRHLVGCLDSSSTATTTSTSSTPTDDTPGSSNSSSSSSGVVPGGYAAALLRPAAPTLVNTTTTTTTSVKKVTESKQESSQLVAKQQQQRSSITTASNKNKGVENSMQDHDKTKVETSSVSVSSSDSASASDDQPVVSIQPPAWGRGRSFADVLAAQ
mmetsp:Transcript_21614/g.23132  ORF Transcript_21614/g.23132 Transcript_21614/m.23132 type:complete len:665 (-) Transcript_21614:326-2320(-)